MFKVPPFVMIHCKYLISKGQCALNIFYVLTYDLKISYYYIEDNFPWVSFYPNGMTIEILRRKDVK